MTHGSRGDFLRQPGITTTALPLLTADAPFDLLITGGRVPGRSRSVDSVMEAGIRGQSIAAVGPKPDTTGVRRVLNASGRVATPGLIDIRGHALPSAPGRRGPEPNGTVQDLVTTPARFLYPGMTLGRLIEAVTANPSRMLKFGQKTGTLEPGVVADISVLRLVDTPFEALDTLRQKRTLPRRVAPQAVVRAGVLSELV